MPSGQNEPRLPNVLAMVVFYLLIYFGNICSKAQKKKKINKERERERMRDKNARNGVVRLQGL